jgi:hypothetical protein
MAVSCVRWHQQRDVHKLEHNQSGRLTGTPATSRGAAKRVADSITRLRVGRDGFPASYMRTADCCMPAHARIAANVQTAEHACQFQRYTCGVHVLKARMPAAPRIGHAHI